MSHYGFVLVLSAVGTHGMSEMSRIFKPPFPSASVEFIPKFKIVTENGPLSISTGIGFPLELELKGEEPKPEHHHHHHHTHPPYLKRPRGGKRAKGDKSESKETEAAEHGDSIDEWRQNRKLKLDKGALDRLQLYESFVASLDRLGVPAKRCLLRAICEVEKYPQDTNESLLGEMVSLVLRIPKNNLPKMKAYNKAVIVGRMGDCSPYYDCFVSVFKMISKP